MGCCECGDERSGSGATELVRLHLIARTMHTVGFCLIYIKTLVYSLVVPSVCCVRLFSD
jgi:hypothetical protein